MPRTPVTAHFSEECWTLLRDRGFEVDAVALSAEVRDLVDRATGIHVSIPDHTLRYSVDMLRLHAYELGKYVAARHRALPADDRRRRVCERCLDEIDEAIRHGSGT